MLDNAGTFKTTAKWIKDIRKNEKLQDYLVAHYEVIFPSKLNNEFCATTMYFDTRFFCENAAL